MSHKYYDIIIIGSGMAGLYSAYNIKKYFPNTTFLILEKYKKQWIGGRTSNDIFYGTEIVTGAGIGRKNKDKLLLNLLKTFDLDAKEFMVYPDYSQLLNPIDLNEIIKKLKDEYKKYKGKPITFKEFAKNILGEKQYKLFLMTSGYTDYENEDVFETLYYYGLEDNAFCWKGFHVSWKLLVHKLAIFIGESHFKFSNNVIKITKTHDNPCNFIIETENNLKYTCNKVIVATTISSLKKFFPNNPVYNDIVGQPFLRLYGKFSKSSIPIMKEYVSCITMVPGPLQKLIPINSDRGIYMIVYNDNNNTLALKEYLKNTEENRDEFIDKAQHPEKGVLVVGEVVSHDQGWTEGALKSVKAVLSKKWIKTEC